MYHDFYYWIIYGTLYYIYSNVNKVPRIDSSCNDILSVT